jgi:hypothetical protein
MANLAEFSPISEISTEKNFWNLKARVIRLWQVSDLNRNTLPFSTEMVLMDEAGNRIHASLKKTLLYKFKNDIFEGKYYSFENMGVANNGGNYRTTRHPFKLNFQFGSKVVFLPTLSITKSPYNFVPIPEIVGGSYDTDYLPGNIIYFCDIFWFYRIFNPMYCMFHVYLSNFFLCLFQTSVDS